MSDQQQQKKKSKSKVAPVNSTAFAGRWGAVPQTDQYKTPKDKIWGDVIRHERVLEKAWNETWVEQVEVGEPVMPSKKVIKSLPFYRPKPSPGLPVKASSMVGWRASDPENAVEFFKIQYTPQKKRFVLEQYGYYRIMKYFRADADAEKADESPQKYIRPIIKRILC